MDHNYGNQMTGFSKELHVIQETIAHAINDDIKSFAMTTWFPSIDAVEAGRFRLGRKVESVRERRVLLKKSGRRTVEEHKNRSRRERRRDPIIAWRYSLSGESLYTLTLLERFTPASRQKLFSSSNVAADFFKILFMISALDVFMFSLFYSTRRWTQRT